MGADSGDFDDEGPREMSGDSILQYPSEFSRILNIVSYKFEISSDKKK